MLKRHRNADAPLFGLGLESKVLELKGFDSKGFDSRGFDSQGFASRDQSKLFN